MSRRLHASRSRLAAISLAAQLSCTGAAPGEAPCRLGGDTCERALAAWGITPPRGTFDLPLRGEPTLRISPTAIFVRDEPVLALTNGRPAPGQFVDHVAPSLRDALAALATSEQALAATQKSAWHARLTLLADRSTPSSTLADILFTALKAGFADFDLVVQDGRLLRAQAIAHPFAWLDPDPDIRYERALEVLFAVHRDSAEVSVARAPARAFPPSRACDPPVATCHDLAAITAFAAELKQRYPNEVVATFRADGEVPLQAVVSLLDAVRGPSCRLSGAIERGEKIPDECLFWQAILDVEPPFHHDGSPRNEPAAATPSPQR